jgi:hypothetical protein
VKPASLSKIDRRHGGLQIAIPAACAQAMAAALRAGDYSRIEDIVAEALGLWQETARARKLGAASPRHRRASRQPKTRSCAGEGAPPTQQRAFARFPGDLLNGRHS